MNAILIMPPKFFADFSNRVTTRRHSFSQPITHSTMLRRRYASRSNSTGRADRSSFSLDGITGLIPNSNRYSSIQPARYPLSPARATGQATGAPPASRTTSSAPTSSGTKAVLSCACPAVRWKWSG